ncbi:MAG: hypothetical protein JO149_09435 [Gammaproteobacteria bacterium]|nr:hypothetical protein [Gammaproteobacteria bacterium]
MKKLLILALTYLSISTASLAFADNTANIRIKMTGATQDNRYFLCLPDVGCLSILAAQKGKIYPIIHSIEMSNIFVTDVSNNLKVSPQGLPASCNVTVAPNQTITITGSIKTGSNKSVYINQLHCTVTG